MTSSEDAPLRRPRGMSGRVPVAAVVLFLSFVDVFALLPTVAPHATSLGASAAMLGLLVGAYSASNLFANVLGGVLVDRQGRRRVVLIGLALSVLALLAYPLAADPVQLLAARLAHGVAGGILVPAVFALAGDGAAAAGRTGRMMGRMGALIGAAAVVAPAGAGVVRQVAGTDTVFVTVAAVLLIGWLITFVGVTDTGSATAARTAPQVRLARLLALPALRRTLAATATLTVAVGALAAFLPGRVEAMGASPALVGALFTVYALAAAGVMLGPVVGRVDHEGGDRLAAIGLAALAVALGGVALAPGIGVAVAAMVVFGVGYGLIFPAVTATTSLLAGQAARGRAFGLFNAAFSVGLAGGPPLLGLVTERMPALDPFVLAAGLMALVGAGIAVAARVERRAASRADASTS